MRYFRHTSFLAMMLAAMTISIPALGAGVSTANPDLRVNRIAAMISQADIRLERLDASIDREAGAVGQLERDLDAGADGDTVIRELQLISQRLDDVERTVRGIRSNLFVAGVVLERISMFAEMTGNRELKAKVDITLAALEAALDKALSMTAKSTWLRGEVSRVIAKARSGK